MRGSGKRILYVDRTIETHSNINIASETLQISYSRMCLEIWVADYFLGIDEVTKSVNAYKTVRYNEIGIEEKVLECMLLLSLKAGVVVVHDLLKLLFRNRDTFRRLVKNCH